MLAVRVRDDIQIQRYMQTFSVLRGNILFVTTELCLSHIMVTYSSPIYVCLPLSHSLTIPNFPSIPL